MLELFGTSGEKAVHYLQMIRKIFEYSVWFIFGTVRFMFNLIRKICYLHTPNYPVLTFLVLVIISFFFVASLNKGFWRLLCKFLRKHVLEMPQLLYQEHLWNIREVKGATSISTATQAVLYNLCHIIAHACMLVRFYSSNELRQYGCQNV